MRQSDLDGVDGADQVGVDHVYPGLQLRLALHACDTGRRHDDVEPAELGDAAVERLAQLLGLANVGLCGDDALTGLLDQLGGLVEILRLGHRVADCLDVVADVDRDDVGALLGQPNRVAAALPARSAGDECNFSLNASHYRCPFSAFVRV